MVRNETCSKPVKVRQNFELVAQFVRLSLGSGNFLGVVLAVLTPLLHRRLPRAPVGANLL